MSLKIALAQLNCFVGDLSGNVSRIVNAAETASAQKADLLITPELSLCGAACQDLFLRADFLVSCEHALAQLVEQTASLELAILVGHPLRKEGRLFNGVSFIQRGKILATVVKPHFSPLSALDESRYFEAGEKSEPVLISGVRCQIEIGLLSGNKITEPASTGDADLRLFLDASPYCIGLPQERFDTLLQAARLKKTPAIYVNLVGGQDALVFDGGSFALNRQGELCAHSPRFEDALTFIEFAGGDIQKSPLAVEDKDVEAEIYQALVFGLKEYVQKNGFPGVLLGLSGGMDSALCLCLAVDALGADKVRAVMMPSPYTAQISLDDAREMANLLNVRYSEIPIEPAMHTFSAMLADEFAGKAADTTEENIQARTRGMLLMALSNKIGSLVLTTGNKSETAVGYCTLYGDMAGGFSPISDVPKTLVYRLGHWRNRLARVIPERILTRAPSAELKPGQTDQDNLPPYDVLDAMIKAYVEEGQSATELISQGFSSADVAKFVRLLKISDYKRQQAPVGISLTKRSFGNAWRYPITNRNPGS